MQSPLALSPCLVSSWGAVERMDSALDFLQRFSGIFLPSQGSSYLNDVSLCTRRHRCRLALYQIKIPKKAVLHGRVRPKLKVRARQSSMACQLLSTSLSEAESEVRKFYDRWIGGAGLLSLVGRLIFRLRGLVYSSTFARAAHLVPDQSVPGLAISQHWEGLAEWSEALSIAQSQSRSSGNTSKKWPTSG
jgi:hypothetical protein